MGVMRRGRWRRDAVELFSQTTAFLSTLDLIDPLFFKRERRVVLTVASGAI
jgi:hypothetical protein